MKEFTFDLDVKPVKFRVNGVDFDVRASDTDVIRMAYDAQNQAAKLDAAKDGEGFTLACALEFVEYFKSVINGVLGSGATDKLFAAGEPDALVIVDVALQLAQATVDAHTERAAARYE